VLDREQLETFATIVECGSFERAASALSVTRGAVSQRIRALEESLATVLLLREKPVRPTHRGEVLLRHVKALRVLEGATLHEVAPGRRSNAPVHMAVAVNADSLAVWFGPVIQALLGTRRVALEVISDDQDHTFSRLSRGEVIGCVSAQAEAIQGFAAEPLGALEYRCVASSAFAEQQLPNGLALPALLNVPALLFDRKDSLHDTFLARHFGFAVERYLRHYIPSPEGLLNAVTRGGGYALLPAAQVASLLKSGALVDLAPAAPMQVALHWHHWRTELPIAQELSRIVVAEARRSLLPLPQ